MAAKVTRIFSSAIQPLTVNEMASALATNNAYACLTLSLPSYQKMFYSRYYPAEQQALTL
jgi:hypothetical protein